VWTYSPTLSIGTILYAENNPIGVLSNPYIIAFDQSGALDWLLTTRYGFKTDTFGNITEFLACSTTTTTTTTI
jgi:hypothetical protein